MRREMVTVEAVRSAGINAQFMLNEDSAEADGVYERFCNGSAAVCREYTVCLHGVPVSVVETDAHALVFYCEYVIENGVETEEVDCAVVSIFKLN